MRHMSKLSSMTTRPMRSQNSSSSGDGGLWLVRMAFTPAAFMICNCAFGGAAIYGGAQARPDRGAWQTPCSFRWRAVQQETLLALNSMVRMPKGVT